MSGVWCAHPFIHPPTYLESHGSHVVEGGQLGGGQVREVRPLALEGLGLGGAW